ncbi:sulfur carrier protein ThiS [Eubacterium xylanophilum]|uniref:sulfur carrier protein ThiS n=1 Tax=Eubacterium xylanophilum TaxID=39497 RepID=UPI00047DB07B|nr:sulfur carrier protein ThiS [Eubacterium xylanophilum]MCR5798376.1 sulfur carrier protein ThiS [Eubacterium sp.]
MVKINGEIHDYAGLTIADMLEKMNYKREKVAVEVNYEIVSKADYEATLLKDEDNVEVVQFVGGG